MTHVHEWQPTNDVWACAECAETSETCQTCHNPTGTSLLVCAHCVDAEKRVLVDIMDALAWYQPDPTPIIRAARYDKIIVHGSHGPSKPRSTPTDITNQLHNWATIWGASNPREHPADYLSTRLIWAAHNTEASQWENYRSAIRKLRHQARAIAHLLPRREPGPCIHCGGTIVRDWAERDWTPREDGLSEIARCTRCGTEWESWTRLSFAQRHTIKLLPQVRPEVLVTLANALTIWPNLPKSTLWTWVERDRRAHDESVRQCDQWEDAWTAWHDAGNHGPWTQPPKIVERAIPERGWDARGVPVYTVGDIAAMMARRATEDRPGRRAAV